MLALVTHAYAIAVLIYVASTPDIRIRCLLVDDQAEQSPGEQAEGVIIRGTPGLAVALPDAGRPQPGDRLLSLAGVPTYTLIDIFEANERTFDINDRKSWPVDAETEEVWAKFLINPIVVEANGPRMWVRAKYFSQAEQRTRTSYIEVQSTPWTDFAFTLAWLIPHLTLSAIAGLAWWNRPYDPVARMFFLMLTVTLGAYLGGFHWWTIANSVWLLAPFAVYGMLLPAVTLHFFLTFPQPYPPLQTPARRLLAIPYVVGLGGAFVIVAGIIAATVASGADSTTEQVTQNEYILRLLRTGVEGFLIFAGSLYLLSCVALIRGFIRTSESSVKSHSRLILIAAAFGLIPLAYVIGLAVFDRPTFAFGGARIPMLLIGLGFNIAYIAGIGQERLLVIDEILGRGSRYLGVTAAISVVFGLVIGLVSMTGHQENAGDTTEAAIQTSLVVAVVAVALLWIRDRLQGIVDRRFYRDKYQLDEAIGNVKRAFAGATDPESIGTQILKSCHEGLGVSSAALYRRDASSPYNYKLAAQNGVRQFASEVKVTPRFVSELQSGAIQRVPAALNDPTPVQAVLKQIPAARLVYGLPDSNGVATFVALGGKPNGGFSAEDLAFLDAVGQLTSALFAIRLQLDDELDRRDETIAVQARQMAALRSELELSYGRSLIVDRQDSEFRRDVIRGDSPAIAEVLNTVKKVSRTNATVLIRGESGTGKELLAQVLHENSSRKDGPFVKVHCASLAPSLLESELFGHVKGAFTGAHRDKVGRFESADGGTLFLDEIGDISLETQVKLLRVLQERCFEPVGGSESIRVDVRLITATNRDLESLIELGQFRDDLYYRLNVISLTVPPLRDRKEDIYELAYTFLHSTARKSGHAVRGISEAAFAMLMRHDWPGNVRELQNVMERAVVLADGDEIGPADLPAEMAALSRRNRIPAQQRSLKVARPPGQLEHRFDSTASPAKEDDALPPTASSDSAGDTSEQTQLVEALEATGGNKSAAARRLGIPRSTFFSKLKKYDMT
ncbi:Transcriptional regulatory protein ZraR [Stratiformator vulcanicus]|uniref:Transcriptional regulatory protein ZraR n=1 Tax=Stratiformator vulcanicus TaxID=2527980 RepID=A0A517R4G2_9PLAN|nr:Transcriptional regulatory protein ZraR [Stratiformator vulcanicus]